MMAKIETSIKKLLKDKKAAKKIEDELAKKRSKQNKSTSGNFAIMKGKLDWPISGKVVSKFGFHTNPKLNTKIENLGIDIKTDKNEKIYPVLDGVVSIITYNREYGNMIIVSHGGGYHTVYANVENIMVNENDYIESNTKIGEVSKSSISNEHLLHFQIWKNESKLNPEDWLK
jgi:septal ring factor EnvC (AmiA/AmiB activator)